jgi:hypothetical protein
MLCVGTHHIRILLASSASIESALVCTQALKSSAEIYPGTNVCVCDLNQHFQPAFCAVFDSLLYLFICCSEWHTRLWSEIEDVVNELNAE